MARYRFSPLTALCPFPGWLCADSYPDALALYLLMNIELWAHRCSPTTGLPYNNGLMLDNLVKWRIRYRADQPDTLVAYSNTIFPPWWGDARVHDSDKAILYRKDHTAYAHFKRYALQYEQYVWPYQIEEEARRRQRQAAGVEAGGRHSEGDEEPEGFALDEVKDERRREEAEATSGSRRAKQSRTVRVGKKRSTKRRRADSAVELDEDDEQVDAAVVAAMQVDHEANEAKSELEGGREVRQQNTKRRKRRHTQQQDESEASAAAIQPTEEEADGEGIAAGDEVNAVQPEQRSRARGKQRVVKRLVMEDTVSAVNEVSAASPQPQSQQQQQQQRHGKPRKRKVHKSAEGGDAAAERRRSGRRTSVIA